MSAYYTATCPKGHRITELIQAAFTGIEIERFSAKRMPITANVEHKLYLMGNVRAFGEDRDSKQRVIDDTDLGARYVCANDCRDLTYDDLVFEEES
jgi:hypothetical protein